MGSMAAEDVTSSYSVVPKSEPTQDGYTPSSVSSLEEAEAEAEASAELSVTDPPPVPKRKGGRKPIYATSEERKQRNRQAQAAFRERRTEYIKQLETTIQHHEETLQTLQQSHRTAADECLMLRYKNSLLERILLEKGIDVQAELRLKGSPHLRPIRHGAGMTGQASPMQKAMLNRRQHAGQRAAVAAAPPIQTVNAPQLSIGNLSGSPTVQPTPPSQQSSPSALRSPGFSMQGSLRSPTNDVQMQQQQAQLPPRSNTHIPQNHYGTQPRTHLRHSSSTGTSQSYGHPPRQLPQTQQMHQEYYPSTFQKHYDQLDQEYDAQTDMIDDVEGEELEPDSFIPNFRLPPSNGNLPIGMQASPPTTASAASDGGAGAHSLPFEYDPMLDADPFGLTASMHFPNPYTFPPSQARR